MIRCRKVSLSHKEVSKLFPVHVMCFQHILENTFTYLHLSVCLGPCCLMGLGVLNERKIEFGIQAFKICQSQLSESICLVYFEIYKSCFEGIEIQLTFQVEMYSWYEWCQTFSFKFCAICTFELRG